MPLAVFVPGPMALVIIGIIAVLLFGNRLPKVARSVGSSFVEFKRGLRDVQEPLDDAAEELNKAIKR